MQNQRCIVIGSGSGPSGSEIVPVVATFTTVFGTTQNVDCRAIATRCNVALFVYNVQSQLFFLRQVPISFASEIPRPAVAVAPAAFLLDSDVVTATLTGWQGASVALSECVPGGRCVALSAVPNAVDGTTASVTVLRTPAVAGPPVDCFAVRSCSIRAVGTVAGSGITAETPIFFGRSGQLSLVVSPKGGPSPRTVSVTASGFATGFAYRVRECVNATAVRCGPAVSVAENVLTTMTVSDSVDGSACPPNLGTPVCSLVLEATGGTVVDRVDESVSFDPGVITVSRSIGLADHQVVQVFGLLAQPSERVVVRQCLRFGTTDRCTRGKQLTTFPNFPRLDYFSLYQVNIRVQRYVGISPRRGCLRNPCRFEVLADGVLQGSVPVTFANPPTTLSAASVETTEGTSAHLVLRLARATNVDVRVRLTTGDAGARSSGVAPDYEARDVVVVIPAGATSAAVDVPVFSDAETEFDELFAVVLHEQEGAVLPPRPPIFVTIHDAPAPG